MIKAVTYDGVELMGYTPWAVSTASPLPPASTANATALFYVNKHDDGTGDMSCSRKKSFNWYKEVIASNGENL